MRPLSCTFPDARLPVGPVAVIALAAALFAVARVGEPPDEHRAVTTEQVCAQPSPPEPPPASLASAPDPTLTRPPHPGECVVPVDPKHATPDGVARPTRSRLHQVLSNPVCRAVYQRVIPGCFGSNPSVGHRIQGLRAGSELASLGLRNGDIVQSVGDADLRENALAAPMLEALRHAVEVEPAFEIVVLRRGQEHRLVVAPEDAPRTTSRLDPPTEPREHVVRGGR